MTNEQLQVALADDRRTSSKKLKNDLRQISISYRMIGVPSLLVFGALNIWVLSGLMH